MLKIVFDVYFFSCTYYSAVSCLVREKWYAEFKKISFSIHKYTLEMRCITICASLVISKEITAQFPELPYLLNQHVFYESILRIGKHF